MINKARNVVPKPEDITLDEWYAFTINPEYQGDSYLTDRVKSVVTRIKTLLMNECIKYTGMIELSSTGRVHLHGYIKIINYDFYTRYIPELIKTATVVIKEIDDNIKWNEYIKKQIFLPWSKRIDNFKPEDLNDFYQLTDNLNRPCYARGPTSDDLVTPVGDA